MKATAPDGTSWRIARRWIPRYENRGLRATRTDEAAGIARGPRRRNVAAMDVSHYRHEESIVVDRPPNDVYAIVSDVTRIGELSPVATGAEWDDASRGAAPGSWFTGRNAIGDLTWETRCEVVEADPGRAFAFVNHGAAGDRELVRWGYRFEPEGDGTRLTETWEVLPAYPDFVSDGDPAVDVAARIDGMAAMARDGIRDTLAAIKRLAES